MKKLTAKKITFAFVTLNIIATSALFARAQYGLKRMEAFHNKLFPESAKHITAKKEGLSLTDITPDSSVKKKLYAMKDGKVCWWHFC